LPPEIGMIPKVRGVVRVANKYGGGIPTLIGEWGYDVHSESPQNAPAYSNYTSEQSRAHLAVRAILGFSQAGAWGAEWYRLYQDYYPGDPKGGNYANDNNPTQFATMALLRQIDDDAKIIKRTLVGDYFKQLSQFGDYVFSEAIRNDSIWVLKFTDAVREMYAIWGVEKIEIDKKTNIPVYIERKGSYKLNVKGTLYSFNDDGSGEMTQKEYSATVIEYSAKPVLMVVKK
jgi:hypothetical protein